MLGDPGDLPLLPQGEVRVLQRGLCMLHRGAFSATEMLKELAWELRRDVRVPWDVLGFPGEMFQ